MFQFDSPETHSFAERAFLGFPGVVDPECPERPQGVSDVHGKRYQVRPQLWNLHHNEPGIRRPNRASG